VWTFGNCIFVIVIEIVKVNAFLLCRLFFIVQRVDIYVKFSHFFNIYVKLKVSCVD